MRGSEERITKSLPVKSGGNVIGQPDPEKAWKSIFEEFHSAAQFSDDTEGTWLVSYADMMTLLFGFFVVLTTFSMPNAAQLEKMRKATAKAMGGKYQAVRHPINDSLKQILSNFHLESKVAVVEQEDGVALVSNGTLFFDSSSAVLNPEAKELMGKVADLILTHAKGYRITVEGHTDDVPIESKMFPSNWELSSVRADSVVRLFEQKGIPHKDLRPIGLGDTQPLVPNRTREGQPLPDNQAKNRRVVIRIQHLMPSRISGGGNCTMETAVP